MVYNTGKEQMMGKNTNFFWTIHDKQYQSKSLYYDDIEKVQLRSFEI